MEKTEAARQDGRSSDDDRKLARQSRQVDLDRREYQSPLFVLLWRRPVLAGVHCEFVALAKDLNLPLVTADKQILTQFPDVAVSLATFVRG
jgi:hypothetical protein